MKMKWWYHVIELDFEALALCERSQLNFQSYFEWTVQQHAHHWSKDCKTTLFERKNN